MQYDVAVFRNTALIYRAIDHGIFGDVYLVFCLIDAVYISKQKRFEARLCEIEKKTVLIRASNYSV
jgi:hypothetical protein